jgi:chemotaxis protein CheD
MNEIVIGVGDYVASKTSGDLLRADSLGSCVGVVFLAPSIRGVGLLQVALPDSSVNPERAREKPGTFADTGIPALLDEMKRLGFENGRLFVKLAGGAAVRGPNHTFNVGKQNILAVRKALWTHKLWAVAEDLEGSINRSISVEVNTGKVTVSSPGRGAWEL